MTKDVLGAVIGQLGHLSHHQDRPLSVVLHGGEPLLLGLPDMHRLIEGLSKALRSDAGLHIQTNGVLLSDDFIDLFAKHDVGISISLDGTAEVHDRNRLDRKGLGSYARVVEAIARVLVHPAGKDLLSGLLAVVDPSSDPIEVYEALKATGAPAFDFLYRDGNHSVLPPGKANFESTEYGNWMVRLLDHYLADPTPPRIRVLDDLMRLILGGWSRKEGVGPAEYGILVVDTDGTLTRNDTLKVAHAGADRFKVQHSIVGTDLLEFINAVELDDYLRLHTPTSPICRRCPELAVCGGGMPAHRWSRDHEYDNPTVFCRDQQLLIAEMRGRVGRTLDAVVDRTGSHAW
jgi:uncharacterized protein